MEPTTHDLITYWAASMRAQNLTNRTIKERTIFVHSLIKHTGQESLLTITKRDLIAFLGRDGLTGRTRQNYRSCLHTLFTWLQDEELRPDNPAAKLPRPKVEPTEANPVTTEQIQHLLNSGIYGRTRMMVILYAYEGLRASEIAAVDGNNVDWDKQRIRTIEGKGGKVVWRPMHPLTWEAAQHYPRTGAWFPGVHGHIRGKTVSTTLSLAMRRAGLEGHTGHDMRAWHATELLEAGVDSRTVQYSMRHGDQQSLIKYDKPSDNRIREGREHLPRVVVPIRSNRRPVAGVGRLAA